MANSFRTPLWLSVAFMLFCQAICATETSTDKHDKHDKHDEDVEKNSVATATSNDKNETGLVNQITSLLSNGGTVVVGVVAIGAILALVLPLFGIKLCQLIGTCEHQYQGYAANSVYNDAYSQAYPQASAYQTPTTYQKRSAEYIGPILHVLKAAYDKYGQLNNLASSSKKA